MRMEIKQMNIRNKLNGRRENLISSPRAEFKTNNKGKRKKKAIKNVNLFVTLESKLSVNEPEVNTLESGRDPT